MFPLRSIKRAWTIRDCPFGVPSGNMAPETFEQWWLRLIDTLHAGTEIFHWSARNGPHLDGSFIISDVNTVRREIWIRNPDSVIMKSEFAKVFPLWGDYCREIVARKRISDLTTRSTYIISIMRWMENAK
jgi:hypothetical protein